MNLELRDYQQQRLLYHLGHERSCEFCPPGRGKTPVACIYTKIMLDSFHYKSVWVQPVSLLAKNKDELLKWTGLKDEEVALLNVSKDKRDKIYKDPKVKVYLVGGSTFAKEWREFDDQVQCVIVDECHNLFGTHESLRTQSMYASSRRFKRFLFMTGTPVAGRYDSAYPMIAVCEPRFYGTVNSFRNYHGVYNKYNQVVSWRNGDKLKEVLKRISSGLEDPFAGRECETHIITEKCNFDPKMQAAYKDMEEEALVELEDGYLDARGEGGVKQMRCRQILSCPEAVDVAVDSYGKDDLLKLHIENALIEKERIVVFSVFVAEQERIKKLCDEMGVRSAIMNGSTSSERRGILDEKFRNHELDVMIASPKVAGLGMNWEFAHSAIFCSLGFDNSEFKQACARLDRSTRTRPVLIYVLTYGTRVEKRVMQIILRKDAEMKKVMLDN